MTSNLICPKCGGADYFLSERNVVKGIGGIYGNRGGTKKFPVCRTCDEIMAKSVRTEFGTMWPLLIGLVVLSILLMVFVGT